MSLLSFDFDFKKLITMILGSGKRRTIRIAWLTAIHKHLQNIHDDFIAFKTETDDKVKWNGQTIILQAMLREKFGDAGVPGGNYGIDVINNVSIKDALFVNDHQEVISFIHHTQDSAFFFYDSGDIEVNPFDFTVEVSDLVEFEESDMRRWIDKYIVYGRRYNIVIVS